MKDKAITFSSKKISFQPFQIFFIILIWSISFANPAQSKEQPNILLLVAEDLSNRLGAYGDQVAKTPNIDRLAQSGQIFTNVFTTAGVCAPSRAALITGQHQISMGAQHMRSSTSPHGKYFAQPSEEVKAFPEILRAKGYFTFTDRKLDYQFSGIYSGTGPFTIWDVEGEDHLAWRQRKPGQPFFGLINFSETHESGLMRHDGVIHSESHRQTIAFRQKANLNGARITDPKLVNLEPYYPDLPKLRTDIAQHYNNIHKMDKRVGKILKDLAADNLENNTVIIWTSDHGDGLPRAKRELYDSGIKVPMIIAGNQNQSSAPDHQMISFVDLAPTILGLADIEKSKWHHGRNFLTNNSQKRKYVFASRDRIDEVDDRQRAVRDQRYKYIRSFNESVPGGHPLAYRDNLEITRAWREAHERGLTNAIQSEWFKPFGRDKLFDLKKDPHETVNLVGDSDYAEIKDRLSSTLYKFINRHDSWENNSEKNMREVFLREGQIRQTRPPEFFISENRIVLTSSSNASIGWRIPGARRWEIYSGPIDSEVIEAKSVRYGWLESEVLAITR